MKTSDKIPGGLAFVTVLVVILVFFLLGTLGLRWFGIELSDIFDLKKEESILTISEYQSEQANPTAFQPLIINTSKPTITIQPTVTATSSMLPTSTRQLTPTAMPTEIEIPVSYYISGLYGMAQLTTLDCEARSAVDWARYFGVTIDEIEFIDKIPFSDDPEIGFVGDINGAMGQLPPDGYGVYPPPIASILQEYGLNAQAVIDFSYEDLRREISNDRPVIVWIVNLPFEIEQSTYTASNGNTVPVAPFEHTWIVTGYNLSTVTVVDSEWTYNVKLSTFLERWAVFENRAIIIQE